MISKTDELHNHCTRGRFETISQNECIISGEQGCSVVLEVPSSGVTISLILKNDDPCPFIEK